MEIGITKMSTKGQIVIPNEIRNDFEIGEKLIVIKKASSLDKKFSEDIAFAKETEEAYQRIKSGKGTTMDFDDFIEEMKKW